MTSPLAFAAFLAVAFAGGSGATMTGEGPDASIAWVRAVLQQDIEAITRLTSVPFQFRTTSADRRCEGWVRTTKALRAWAACLSARPDVRQLEDIIDADGVTISAGWASAGMGTPKADDIALKIGGRTRWSDWRAVVVSHLWTTFQIRLLERARPAPTRVEAAVIDIPKR